MASAHARRLDASQKTLARRDDDDRRFLAMAPVDLVLLLRWIKALSGYRC